MDNNDVRLATYKDYSKLLFDALIAKDDSRVHPPPSNFPAAYTEAAIKRSISATNRPTST